MRITICTEEQRARGLHFVMEGFALELLTFSTTNKTESIRDFFRDYKV